MKTIVYATDFSKNSVPALKIAYTLSQQLKMQLVVLHVFDMGLTFSNPLSMTYAKKEKEAFSKHRETLKEFYGNYIDFPKDNISNIHIEIRENTIVKEGIQEVISEYNADMLVMGFQGKSALKEVFIGSNTKNMVSKSSCPILAVPSGWDRFEVKNITYASDFEEADIRSIDWLVNTLARPLDSNINVLHISTEKEYAGEDQLQWFQEMLEQKVTYKKINFKMIESEDVFGQLLEAVAHAKTDILVMLEREKEGFFTSLIQGDKVMQMISEGNVPLLTFNKNLF